MFYEVNFLTLWVINLLQMQYLKLKRIYNILHKNFFLLRINIVFIFKNY